MQARAQVRERGCECQRERKWKARIKERKGEREWPVCYVSVARRVCVYFFVYVCVYFVGLQINPVGFILSEWDSGALQ